MIPPVYKSLSSVSSVAEIVDKRIYGFGEAPQNVTKPYVVWQIVTATPENTLSENPDIDAVALQIDCYSPTQDEATDLAIAVRDAIQSYGYVTGLSIFGREAETKLYRIAIDVDWWLNRQ